MRYAAWADVVARYPKAAGSLQFEEVVAEANFIAGAEGEVDGALAVRYSVPVASTPTLAPSLVRDVTIDLAYYKAAFLQLSDEQAKRLWEYIQSRLLGLSTGSLTLVSSGVVLQPVGTAFGTTGDHTNITGTDAVENWEVSSGELLAECSRRGQTC